MKILVTGGAGFIGSNLVEALLNQDNISLVRVIDNLSNGFYHNLKDFESNNKFEFIEGDICDMDTCRSAVAGIDIISHQAALGSVPRSIKDPINTNRNNIDGTLNVFVAAKEAGIKNLVYAASSSTYGDEKSLPKKEDVIGKPLSPYAITKLVNELYADVFSDLYGMSFIGLRYFNVFGPKQDPNGAYAAVIPLFMKAAIQNNAPTINGDGTYSRDFTYVANAVHANICAINKLSQGADSGHEVCNIACGHATSLNELWKHIQEITSCTISAEHGPQRAGDIPHSLADISKAHNLLNYSPLYSVKQGLSAAYDWYKDNL